MSISEDITSLIDAVIARESDKTLCRHDGCHCGKQVDVIDAGKKLESSFLDLISDHLDRNNIS